MSKDKHDPEQLELINEERDAYSLTPEAQAQRNEYRQRLLAALRDPEFRSVEGFPIGDDKTILALSDPPFYTACPNPFLGEIIAKWQTERDILRQELGLPDDAPEPQIREGVLTHSYHREPFASDVSEGKSDPIYNAHMYHTKVPHKAIMRYILHYTDPGDIVLDGFCGTGMTGVAAQLCGDSKAVGSLGYRVDDDGSLRSGEERATAGSLDAAQMKSTPRLGSRRAVLVDLSPAATFIACNYNTPVNTSTFVRESKRILAEVEQELGWMYETWHPNSESPQRIRGRINYTIWSDVFLCAHCSKEMNLWDVAVEHTLGAVQENWVCPFCSTLLSRNPKSSTGAQKAEHAHELIYDRITL